MKKLPLPPGVELPQQDDPLSLSTQAAHLDSWDKIAAHNLTLCSRGEEALYLGAELFIALRLSLARSIAGQFSARLLSGMVKHGHFSLREARSIATQHPNKRARAESLAALSGDTKQKENPKELSEAERRALLGRAFTEKSEVPDFQRADLFVQMAKAPLDLLPEVLAYAPKIDDFYQAHLFIDISHRLTGDLLSLAWELAQKIATLNDRAKACCALANRLPEAMRSAAISRALSEVGAIDPASTLYDTTLFLCLRALASGPLPSALEGDVLSLIGRLKTRDDRQQMLAIWTPLLSVEARQAQLRALREVHDEPAIEEARLALSGALPPAETKAASMLYTDAEVRASLDSLCQSERTMRDITDPYPDHSDELFAVAPSVNAQTWKEALTVARRLNNADVIPSALVAIIHAAPLKEREAIIEEALLLTRGMSSLLSRASALLDVAEVLHDANRREALYKEVLAVLRAMDGSGEYSNDAQYRLVILRSLDAQIYSLPRGRLYPLVQEALRILAALTLADLLQGIVALQRSLSSLNSQREALTGAIEAL